jgi:hypothetical protein
MTSSVPDAKLSLTVTSRIQPTNMSSIHQFIREESANYPITELCRVLRVRRSSYYLSKNSGYG